MSNEGDFRTVPATQGWLKTFKAMQSQKIRKYFISSAQDAWETGARCESDKGNESVTLCNMGLCQTRHKIPLVTLTLRDNITSS